MYNILTLLILVSITNARDISLGSEGGTKIFDENFQASPAIWRQMQNVTINTTDDEVISKIIVKDLRPEKDGDVDIVDGGEGQKKLTLELKSPTVLRGYDFHVEVYATPTSQAKVIDDKKQQDLTHPKQIGGPKNPLETSGSKLALPRTNVDTTKVPESSLSAENKKYDNERKTRDTTHDTKKQNEDNLKPKIPSLTGIETKETEIPTKYAGNQKDGANKSEDHVTERNKSADIVGKETKPINGEARHTRATEEEEDQKILSDIYKKAGNDDFSRSTTKRPTFVQLNKDKNSAPLSPPIAIANDRNARETSKDDKSDETLAPVVSNRNNPTHTTSSPYGRNIPSTLSQEVPTFGLKINTKDHSDPKSNTNSEINGKSAQEFPTIISKENDKTESIINDKERTTRDIHNPDNNENYNISRTLSSSNINNNENNEQLRNSPSALKDLNTHALPLNDQNKNSNPVTSNIGIKPKVENKDEKQPPTIFSNKHDKPAVTMLSDKERTKRDTHNVAKNENYNIPKSLTSSNITKSDENNDQSLKTEDINTPILPLNGQNKNGEPLTTSNNANNPATENKGTTTHLGTSELTNPLETNTYSQTSSPGPNVHKYPIPYPYAGSYTTPKSDHKRDTISADTGKNSPKSPLLSASEGLESSTLKVNTPRIHEEPAAYSTTPKSEHKRDTVPKEKKQDNEEDPKITPKISGNPNITEHVKTPVISIQ
ncbi:myb-like protein X [Achroia grisella]|uniref:myb-like protein X n=1 Tax=Achroia grisella TaxID=688607 RepID=UPI0027D2086C|nr:myb-like protein X [Achroia grisella]